MAYDSPWQRLCEASRRVWETDTDESKDEEFAQNRDNFRKSAVHYGVWVSLGRDPTLVVIVRHKARPIVPANQLSLWPARGIRPRSVPRLLSTG